MAEPARGTDAFGVLAFLLYAVVGGSLVFGFAWALRGAVAVQNDAICRALEPELRTSVTGVVKDPNDAPVAGAVLTFAGTEATHTAKTDGEGRFSAFLPAGRYAIEVRKSGQATLETKLQTPGREAIAVTYRLGRGETIDARGPWEAPDFTAETLTGEAVRLSDFRGKFVVLNFWATWCEPCIAEWPQLDKLTERLGDRDDVVVLAVSIDEKREAIPPFLERMALTDTRTHVLRVSPEQRIHNAFGTEKIPDTYFIDERGFLVHAYVNVRKWGSPEAFHCVDGSSN